MVRFVRSKIAPSEALRLATYRAVDAEVSPMIERLALIQSALEFRALELVQVNELSVTCIYLGAYTGMRSLPSVIGIKVIRDLGAHSNYGGGCSACHAATAALYRDHVSSWLLSDEAFYSGTL